WRLAEDGHEVTLVTPDALVGKELQRMAADMPLRRALVRLGVRFITESAILHWDGKSARIASLLDGQEQQVEADSLVFAATGFAADDLCVEQERRAVRCKAIGDGTAARQAACAVLDGRRVALALRPCRAGAAWKVNPAWSGVHS